jgi:iron complex transport system ATP-binding protein
MKLHVEGLDFSYDSAPILDDIHFEMCNGEIVGIVGPNGTGKSTLIKCVDRILSPSKGSVTLDGMDVLKMHRTMLAKKISYIPQKVSQSFAETVFDVVLMGRKPYMGWTADEKDMDTVISMLQLLNLEALAMIDFNDLSGGQQQKVFIARALAQATSVLLLDEPTSNLDIRHQLEVMDTIRNLVKEKALAAIVAIHDLNLANRYADKILLMKAGRIVAAGNPESVLTEDNIRMVYGVRSIVRHDQTVPYIIPLSPI